MKFRSILLLIAVFFLVGCAKVSNTSPVDIVCLLSKCRNALKVCILLLNQESSIYYAYVAQRYYYALYSLARIVYGPSMMSDEMKGSHERIWESCPKQVKEVYGVRLKKIRVAADYGLSKSDLDDTSYQKDLRDILMNKEAFNCLKNEVVSIYEEVSARPEYIKQCDELMGDIVGAVDTMREKV